MLARKEAKRKQKDTVKDEASDQEEDASDLEEDTEDADGDGGSASDVPPHTDEEQTTDADVANADNKNSNADADKTMADTDDKPKRRRKKPIVEYKVTGVPYARRIAARGQVPIKMPDGILHCGCPEDEALLDFFWFKSGKITSQYNDLTEGWLKEVAEPRPHAFTTALFREMSAMTINDLYLYNANGKRQDLEFRLKRQIARLQTRLKKLEADRAQEDEADWVE